MFSKIKKLVLLFAFIPLISHSQDSLKQNRFVFNGYVKDMQTFIFEDIKGDWTGANLIHNRLNFKWFFSSSFTASAEIRNRFLTGNILSDFPGYNKAFEVDNGIMDLSKNIFDEKSYLLNTAVDRLWIQYSTEKLQVTAGRQRINWGQTFVWNPNDIFNTYSYFDFDYEEKPGSDAIRVQYYSGPASVIEFAVKLNYWREATFAGLYRFNRWNYDFQFLGGIADEKDLIIGTGWSGQVLKGGFRGETTFFRPLSNQQDSAGIFLASVGYDYTFKNSLFVQFECLYNGNKQKSNEFSVNPLTQNLMSAKNLFLSDFSLFGSLSYPVTPLINTSFAAITNPKNKLVFIIPSINISLKENLELSFTGQFLRYTGEITGSQDLNFLYARLKYSF